MMRLRVFPATLVVRNHCEPYPRAFGSAHLQFGLPHFLNHSTSEPGRRLLT